jgi:hypothetical protein
MAGHFEIKYDYDLSPLRDFFIMVKNRLETPQSNLVEAVQAAGNMVMNEWISAANNRFRHSNGGYAQGIVQGVKYPFQDNPLHFVIEHTKKYATWIEQGYDPFDMKKMLQTSNKVRVSKEGHKYLVIPFRHGTPGSKTMEAMPKEIYQQARELKQSTITGRFLEGSQQGAKGYNDAQLLRQYNPKKVERNRYKWGEQLTDKGADGKYSRYDGMTRFNRNVANVRAINGVQAPTGKFALNSTTEDSPNYSSYFTFRVMSEISEGWINPGAPGMYILKDVIERTSERVYQMMARGIKLDMREMGFS